MNSSQICLATTPFHDFSMSTMCAATSMCSAEDMRTALMEARGICLTDEEENEFIPVNPWYTLGERVVRPLIDSGSRLVFKTRSLA